jgi:hypothetical protein
MQGYLMLLLILVAVVIFLPFLLVFVIFIIIAAGILMALARFGVLPGVRVRTYTYRRGNVSGWRRNRDDSDFRFEGETRGGWYQSTQEGEIITLPETALRKEPPPEEDEGVFR